MSDLLHPALDFLIGHTHLPALLNELLLEFAGGRLQQAVKSHLLQNLNLSACQIPLFSHAYSKAVPLGFPAVDFRVFHPASAHQGFFWVRAGMDFSNELRGKGPVFVRPTLKKPAIRRNSPKSILCRFPVNNDGSNECHNAGGTHDG